ncbi:hypothetical protein DM793_12840 [Paenarthrobacter nitroguajacolicus]|uniref:hypothetical protein n=1 Tax=Paenarthrobacter nitroguajacolicus TaxID=211146 RepID=UPI0015C18736|nr:hypothetical protein [Paenarthrobacter nitroguajacolicus]NWL12168.1 hypothetical protein [Paenarthrobacter nitroguajacolicus]
MESFISNRPAHPPEQQNIPRQPCDDIHPKQLVPVTFKTGQACAAVVESKAQSSDVVWVRFRDGLNTPQMFSNAEGVQ